MSELDTIHQIARKTLTFPTSSGGRDVWLWDRTLRILRNVEHICRLPELAEQAISIDRFCLVAAAYFADSGLAHFAGNRKATRQSPPADLTNADLCNVSTQTVSDMLADIITGTRVDKINKIITGSFDRFTDVTEAMILSDGRGLEDLGAAGLLDGIRGQFIDGKGVSDMLENWKRKIEYGYWQARLKESFRFAAVRQVAERRFAAVERFMNQLATENTAGDMEEQLVEMLERK
ncbi:MAG: hypothetical protein H8E62_10265 [Planctomycetes bacterium]|nr:hypothetical protein [Planctomycetota bacterium]